jgi:hypothetical protein
MFGTSPHIPVLLRGCFGPLLGIFNVNSRCRGNVEDGAGETWRTYVKEPLNKSRAGATPALRDGLRERRRREWSIPFARSLTKQTARKAPSHVGCDKIARSPRYTPWPRRPSYDLRRAPCDHPDFISNAPSEDLFRGSQRNGLQDFLFSVSARRETGAQILS